MIGGGLEVGNGMLFPVSVVDGLVHMHGGWHLRMALKWHQMSSPGFDACPTGTAVRTTAGKDLLSEAYDAIIHTAPPFYQHLECPDDDPAQLLHACYTNALNELKDNETRVATPLLGAGCRGFPLEEAMSIAVNAARQWCEENHDRNVTVAFGLLEESWGDEMIKMLQFP